MNKLGIIVLNYNNLSETIECVNHLIDIQIGNELIVVVDNNSTDNSFYGLKKYYKDSSLVQCVTSHKNGGYAYGNNVGMQYAKKNGCNFLCVLNNDVRVTQKVILRLLSYLVQHRDVGLVAPMLLKADGKTVQSTGGSYNYYTGSVKLLSYGMDIDNLKVQSHFGKKIDFISGACMMLPSWITEKIGGIPENYFLYFEETEWCKKILDKNIKIECLKDVYAIHKNAETVGNIEGLNHYFMTRNLLIFENRNATKIQKVCFYIVLLCKIVYRLKYGIGSLKDLAIYRDSLTGSNKYSFLLKSN